MVQFVYKSLNIGTNSLMFRVIDVFILKSIKGLINLCIIGVNYSCDREALYSHGRRRWETSSVGLNGRGNMTSVSLSLSLSLHPNTTFVDVILFISGRHRCVFVFLFGYFSWLRWICLVIAYWYKWHWFVYLCLSFCFFECWVWTC